MPLVGYIRVAGLTSSEAEGAIEAQLRQNNILNDPHVSVFVKEYSSSGVSVVGDVVKPGVLFYSRAAQAFRCTTGRWWTHRKSGQPSSDLTQR